MRRASQIKPKEKHFNTEALKRDSTGDGQREFLQQPKHYKERHRESRQIQRQARRLALLNSLLTLLVIAATYIGNEAEYSGSFTEYQCSALRVLVILASVLQILLTIKGAGRQLELMKLIGVKDPRSNLHLASLIYDRYEMTLLIAEIVHLCIVIPPTVSEGTEVEWLTGQKSQVTFQDLVTVSIFLRFYHVVRFIYSQSPYFRYRAHFYKYSPHRHLHGVYNDHRFIILAQMRSQPFTTIIVVSGAIMLMSGLLFHMVERSANVGLLEYDGPWFIAITQLTVGYGDTSPLTDLGRLIAMGPGLCGIFTLSLVIGYAIKSTKMTIDEKKLTMHVHHKDYIRRKLTGIAATLIQRWWRLKLSRKIQGDPKRLNRLFSYKDIHDKFIRNFARDLNEGLTPELEEQIITFSARMKTKYPACIQILQDLPKYASSAGRFSTSTVSSLSRILSIKQCFTRCHVIVGGGKVREYRSRRSMPPMHNKHKRSSIKEKMNSDMALRKVRMRGSVITSEDSIDSLEADIVEPSRRKGRRTSV